MTLRPDDAGISNVLGAILVFGLLVVTLVVVQFEFAPVWNEDREAALMQEVTTQLSAIKSDLDRQVDNRTNVAIANPLTLQRPGGFRFFNGAQLPGELGFVESAAGLTVDSPKMTILQSGGQDFLGLADDDDWVNFTTAPQTLSDITRVRALRLRIDMDEDVCSTYNGNDTASLVVRDVHGEEAGRATLTWLDLPSELGTSLDIFANFDDGPTADDQVSSETEFFFQSLCSGGPDNFVDYRYFDLLDPSLFFDAVLGTADGPFNLTIQEAGLQASYVIVYDAVAPGGGTTTVGSLGITVEPYNPDPFPAGRIVFQSKNQNFAQQTFVLEHGALLRVQDGAAAMAVPPNFRVSHSSTQTAMDWAIPSLQGGTGALAGSETATVVSAPSSNRIDIRATAATLSFVIPTEYPDAWFGFFDRELRGAGMDGSTEYDLHTLPSGVSLTVTGPSSSDTLFDLYISLRQADIDIELRSSG